MKTTATSQVLVREHAAEAPLRLFTTIVRDLGFPIFVASLLLWCVVVSVPKSVDELKVSVEALRQEMVAIRHLLETMKR